MNQPTPDPRKLEQRLLGQIAKAHKRFGLIEPGSRVMVALSGGKDSWAMLYLLRAWRARVPFDFDLVAVNLDQGHPGFPAQALVDHLEAEGFEHRVVFKDTHSVVKANTPEGKAYCALCSRMRRGILHQVAEELGCRSIALGHHRDDVAETLMLNLFYSGRLRAMPPKLDGAIQVIRPLIFCAEADLATYCATTGAPVLPCDLCGSQPDLKRQAMKGWLNQLEAENPRLKGNILAALGNVEPAHLLDPGLIERLGASAHGGEIELGGCGEDAAVDALVQIEG